MESWNLDGSSQRLPVSGTVIASVGIDG